MSEDPIAELEAQLVDMWRRGSISTRESAHAIDPKLDPACYPLLILLARSVDAVPMATLVQDLGVEKSTLTRQIDAVTRLGLVRRRRNPADARAKLVELTQGGRTRVSEQRDERVARWRRSLEQWDSGDLRSLAALLRRLGEAAS
ncbi:MarR family winged helix-turn-helix transcriptional regulator [Rhodococcus triatomae]